MIKTIKITEFKDNKKLTSNQYSKTFLTPEKPTASPLEK